MSLLSASRVLIVGAGPSGLAALKEMREAGLDAIAVDARPTFGGVFAPDSGVTFEDLHLTISNVFMSFSDFPAPDVDQGVKYWSKAEYFDYLSRYVAHFDLARHIRLQTSVKAAHFNAESSKWEVCLTPHTEHETTQIFDKLIVAAGANHVPKLPEMFGDFTGEVLHSADYHSAEQVRGKKVLVVGMGEGGSDVASSAVETAESVAVWGRRFPDCAPRFVQPFLDDDNYDERQHLGQHHKPNGVLESLTITRAVRNLPLGVWSVALQGLVKQVRGRHGLNSTQGLSHALTSRAWAADYYSSDTSMVPTKSAVTLTAAARRLLDIVIAPEARINGRTLTFRDARIFGGAGDGAAAEPTSRDTHDLDVDVIVACTGFDLNFDWISVSGEGMVLDPNPRTWFKHCFPAKMGEHLAFVGFARPHSGGIPQCAEMISRYIAQIYLGQRQLPVDYADLALSDAAAERACFHLTPDYNVLVDYTAYMMSVAKLIGCEPKTAPRLNAPQDAVKLWTFPLWPCFFRTRGVGAKPETVEPVLAQFGTYDALTPMPLLAIQMVCGIVMPFVNFGAWVAGALIPDSVARSALPKWYKWRMSKMHFLYHNSLTLSDFRMVPTQWLAVLLIAGHVISVGAASTLQRGKRLRSVSN